MENLPTPYNLYTNPRFVRLAILAAAAALSGCGGGGGGDGDGGSSVVSSAAPTATTSAVSTIEDVPTSGTLTASDPDGDPLTYSITSQPAMGSAVITDAETGSFTYTPDPDKNGTDNFSFKANDGSSDSNTADVTITITAENDAPVAQAGTLTTDEDTPANGTLTASDPDGDPLTYSIASPPSMGSAVITDMATGTFSYTPDPEQNGPDNFTFSANDGSTFSNIETVTVTINPVNDPPVATGSCGNTLQSDPAPHSGTLSATDPDSALLTYSLNADGSGGSGPITTANGGTVEIIDQTTGEFTYLPASSGATGRGIDSFTYQVTDTDGEIDIATETVIVGQTIMPLGDSISVGDTDVPTSSSTVGYRLPLYDALITSEFLVDFVGSGTQGSAIAGFDFNHEGHGGWTAFDIAWGRNPGTDGVFAWLDLNPADIILLHAGTNDLNNTDETDIADILNEIDRWEISANGNPVTVVLARIIDQDPHNQDVTDLNISVAAMANDRINNAGDDIVIVDQEFGAGLDYTIGEDMTDKLHPNASGYEKMKNVWLDALTNVNPNTNEVVLDMCP